MELLINYLTIMKVRTDPHCAQHVIKRSNLPIISGVSLAHLICSGIISTTIFVDYHTNVSVTMWWSAEWQPADRLGHYGNHPRPRVTDRGTPSRSGTRG